MRAKLFDVIAPKVVYVKQAWWFPEEGPLEYWRKQSSVNLLFGDSGFDPDIGSEPIKCYVCRVYAVSRDC